MRHCLEIMQEYRVTIERTSHKLDRPFLVLATQNPIESEGTYNLPEAQLDRFMFKLAADYPSVTEEAAVLKLHSQQRDLDLRLAEDLKTVTSPEEIMAMTRSCGEVRVDDKLIDYINTLVRRTRGGRNFIWGPRRGRNGAGSSGAHVGGILGPRLRRARRRGANCLAGAAAPRDPHRRGRRRGAARRRSASRLIRTIEVPRL